MSNEMNRRTFRPWQTTAITVVALAVAPINSFAFLTSRVPGYGKTSTTLTVLSASKAKKASVDRQELSGIGDMIIPAKLQWTNRLFDALVKRDYWIGDTSDRVEEMREAEIVPSCHEGVYPNRFDWKKLVSGFHFSFFGTVQFYNTGRSWDRRSNEKYGRISECLWPPDRSLSRREVSAGHGFHVLWLSSSVFISSLDFEVLAEGGWVDFYDYKFQLIVRENEEKYEFRAYSLSTFEDDQVPPRTRVASPLPLQFFQHVSASLPADYFSELKFTKGRHQFPSSYFRPFFSVLRAQPDDASLDRPWTRVTFDYNDFKKYEQITREDLKIFAQVFHSKVHLTFAGIDPSVSIHNLNEFLQGPLPPGSVTVGGGSFAPNEQLWLSGKDYYPIQAITFESPVLKLSVDVFYTWFSREPLEIILQAQHIQALDALVPRSIWRDGLENREKVFSFLRVFLEENSVLESFTLLVDYSLNSRDCMDLHSLALWWEGGTAPCKSSKLRRCNVSFRGYDNSYRRYGCSTPIKRIKRWDEVVVPALVLNFYRSVTSSPVVSGIIPLAVQSVNMGNLYQKTTNHIPFDMRIANSGLIFEMVRSMTKQTI
jgi:hypothetical protein